MSEPCKACGGSGVIRYMAPGRVAPGSSGCAECGGSGQGEPKIGHAASYGEPWSLDGRRLVAATSDGSKMKTSRFAFTHQGARAVACVNALSGIPDPEQFMADVRELLALTNPLVESDVSQRSRVRSRLAAALNAVR